MARRRRKPDPNAFATRDAQLASDVVAAAIAWHEATPGSRAWEVATERLAKATIKLRAWRAANEPARRAA